MSQTPDTPQIRTRDPKLKGLAPTIIAGIFTLITVLASLSVIGHMVENPRYLEDAGRFFFILPFWIGSVLCAALALRTKNVQHPALVYVILVLNIAVTFIPIVSGLWYSWELTN
jgi:hypothetical protein